MKKVSAKSKSKYLVLLYVLVTMASLSACSGDGLDNQSPPPTSDTQGSPSSKSEMKPSEEPDAAANPDSSIPEGSDEIEDVSAMKIKIIVGDQELTATLEDNATSQALIERLPLTLPMMDLYSREIVVRFDDPLPAEEVRMRGYEVGEIIYWPPRNSFVILYAQNGEQFSMQTIGRVDSGVGLFQETGDIEVTIELLNE